MTINQFQGDYRFLSNFAVIDEWNGKTVEHYYQAAKALFPETRDWILDAKTPGEAKRRGRTTPALRPEWDRERNEVMLRLVAKKFCIPSWTERLVATGDQTLVEGNTWGDVYWGVDLRTGKGQNQLGIILMTVREMLSYCPAQ